MHLGRYVYNPVSWFLLRVYGGLLTHETTSFFLYNPIKTATQILVPLLCTLFCVKVQATYSESKTQVMKSSDHRLPKLMLYYIDSFIAIDPDFLADGILYGYYYMCLLTGCASLLILRIQTQSFVWWFSKTFLYLDTFKVALYSIFLLICSQDAGCSVHRKTITVPRTCLGIGVYLPITAPNLWW